MPISPAIRALMPPGSRGGSSCEAWPRRSVGCHASRTTSGRSCAATPGSAGPHRPSPGPCCPCRVAGRARSTRSAGSAPTGPRSVQSWVTSAGKTYLNTCTRAKHFGTRHRPQAVRHRERADLGILAGVQEDHRLRRQARGRRRRAVARPRPTSATCGVDSYSDTDDCWVRAISARRRCDRPAARRAASMHCHRRHPVNDR